MHNSWKCFDASGVDERAFIASHAVCSALMLKYPNRICFFCCARLTMGLKICHPEDP